MILAGAAPGWTAGGVFNIARSAWYSGCLQGAYLGGRCVNLHVAADDFVGNPQQPRNGVAIAVAFGVFQPGELLVVDADFFDHGLNGWVVFSDRFVNGDHQDHLQKFLGWQLVEVNHAPLTIRSIARSLSAPPMPVAPCPGAASGIARGASMGEPEG